jgi:putative ABC transport system permease protein
MDILPILRALRTSKTGAILIALQMALTLAIVANSVFMIQIYQRSLQIPTGMDEANIFTLRNEWAVDTGALEARIRQDLVVLREIPGVIDAEATGAYPLCGCSSGIYTLELKNGTNDRYHPTSIRTYLNGDHGLNAYGMHLVAGRWFSQAEVGRTRFTNPDVPVDIVISRQLAKEMFPAGDALGQWVSLVREKPSRIVGVVDAGASTYLDGYHEGDAAFASLQYVNNPINYVVRTRPGAQAQVLKAVPEALYGVTRERLITDMRTFTETRRLAAQEKRANTVMLAVICAVLLIVTVFGIVGLTQFWVTQRRRYIGMRRALGARRVDILGYFHTENLLIAGFGCAIGIPLGLCCNIWVLKDIFGLTKMSPAYIGAGALVLLGVSQLAVLWPALRAASLPPGVAARGL